MIRQVLFEITLFLTPFAAYAAFLWATRSGVLDNASWPGRRILWLGVVALVLVIASFVLLAEFSGAPPGTTYVPAHMENGRLVRGTEK
jgi:uncharacterized protein DUF6111